MSGELVPIEPESVVPVHVTPMQLLQMATSQGADVDKLSKLMDLQMRWQADEARKAFVAAMNKFRASPPKIVKNKAVHHNGKFMYRHSTLDNIGEAIGGPLSDVGISYRWETLQGEGGLIKVTCILMHEMGHSESVSLQATPDTSGAKNSIQAVGSTVKYLERYTLMAATGMADRDAKDEDDGAGGKGSVMPERIKADWHAVIDAMDDREQADALWKKIAASCTEFGDVPAYDELKGAMSKRVRAISQGEKK